MTPKPPLAARPPYRGRATQKWTITRKACRYARPATLARKHDNRQFQVKLLCVFLIRVYPCSSVAKETYWTAGSFETRGWLDTCLPLKVARRTIPYRCTMAPVGKAEAGSA